MVPDREISRRKKLVIGTRQMKTQKPLCIILLEESESNQGKNQKGTDGVKRNLLFKVIQEIVSYGGRMR
jgi:hypothetical protein